MEGQNQNMKILCLHGFRTSGKFLQKQISKWDPSLFLHHFQMSDIEGIFPPPYFEWFQFNKEFTEYTNLEECISHLCQYITDNGPFHGLLGFSQGATLGALLLGYKAQGKVLKEHPPFKMFVSISGSKFREPSICEVAYKDKINVKSVHFIGAKDWLKLPSEDLATAFHDPLIIRHPQGHTVPRLDEVSIEQLRKWIANILFDNKDGISKGKEHDEEEAMKVDTPNELQNNIIDDDNNQINALEIATTEEEIPKEMQNKIINNNHHQINASEFAGKEHKEVIQEKSINTQIDASQDAFH
ncbi:dihydrofolate reductase-like [Gossypium australe]|uniref:Dihydrofolate reductase-like n=1 Tax=Gossypium australe TaxID=47621 RepID=A0A5B6V7L9_9ROSI|nr:dihydrofolate reductase-like [Gossypium australe]